MDQLLSDQSSEDRLNKIYDIIQKVAANVREQKVPLASLVITKQLSKNPNEYPDKKAPHVAIAIRLNAQGGRMWKAGDTVPYIVCEVKHIFVYFLMLNIVILYLNLIFYHFLRIENYFLSSLKYLYCKILKFLKLIYFGRKISF